MFLQLLPKLYALPKACAPSSKSCAGKLGALKKSLKRHNLGGKSLNFCFDLGFYSFPSEAPWCSYQGQSFQSALVFDKKKEKEAHAC